MKKEKALIILFIISLSPFLQIYFNFYQPTSSAQNDLLEKEKQVKASSLLFENIIPDQGSELIKNTNYTFSTIVSDPENLTHEFTNAFVETKIVGDDQVFHNQSLDINCSTTKFADPNSISLISGTYDDTDNMKVLDDTYSTFESTIPEVFNATYSFENDINDQIPEDWDAEHYGASSWAYTYESFGGHHKVFRCYDAGGAGHAYRVSLNVSESEEGINAGFVEYYFATSDSTKESTILDFVDGDAISPTGVSNYGTTAFRMFACYLQTGSLYFANGTSYSLLSITNNQWYHIKAKWNTTEDQVSIWVDETLYIENYSLGTGQGYNLTQLNMASWSNPAYFYNYYDAFGFSWDSNYTEGDNLIENPCTSHFDVNLEFEVEYPEDLLSIEIESYHKTDIEQMVNFSIYDFSLDTYHIINESVSYGGSFFRTYFYNDTIVSDFISSSNTIQLNFFVNNVSANPFELYIDMLKITVHYKARISTQLSFQITELYKFRFHIVGSSYYSSWTYFEVLDIDPPTSENLIIEDLSIVNGSDLSENYNYYFNASAYDNSTKNKLFEDGYLITQNFETGLEYQNQISNIDSYEDYYANANSSQITLGSKYDQNFMSAIDGSYNVFSSTSDGHFNGTWSFLEDPLDSIATDISYCDVQTEPYTFIEWELDGHTKICKTEQVGGWTTTQHNEPTNHKNGSMEFWMYLDDATGWLAGTDYTRFMLLEGTDGVIHIRYVDNDIYFLDGNSGWKYAEVDINSKQWYHYRYDWWDNNTFKIYVNNTFIITANTSLPIVDGVNVTYFVDHSGQAEPAVYIDAISYSWDEGYIMGSNLVVPYNFSAFDAYFDFVIDDTNTLAFQLDSNLRTNITQLVNVSIYDFQNLEWVYIDQLNSTSFTNISYYSEDIERFIHYNGTIRIRFSGNQSNEWELHINMLKIRAYNKVDLTIQKSFNIKGHWRYRFYLIDENSNNYYSEFIYFEVIDPNPNCKIVSESNHLTTWEFVDRTVITNDLYEETFETKLASNTWCLYSGSIDISNETFVASYYDNYLKENIIYDSIQYASTQSREDLIPQYSYDLEYGESRLENLGIWITNYITSQCDHHKLDGVKDYSIDTKPQSIYPIGQTIIGNDLYITDMTNFDLFKFNLDGLYQDFSFDLATYGNNAPYYLTNNLTNFFCYDTADYNMYIYNLTGTFIDSFDLSAIINTNLAGLEYDNEFDVLWINDNTNHIIKSVYRNGTLAPYQVSMKNSDLLRGICLDSNDKRLYVNNPTLFSPAFDIYDKMYYHEKFFQGNDHIYLQTNESETLYLKSMNNLNIPLSELDKIEIRFRTTSENQVNFKVYNNETSATYPIVEQNNVNFDWQTAIINIDWNYSVHQIEFNGVFDEETYLEIDYVKFYEYSNVSGIHNYFLEPFGSDEILLDFDTYFTIGVYEFNILKREFNLTSEEELQYLLYDKVETREVYISLYDQENDYLNFYDFSIYANYTFQEELHENEKMSDNILIVDKDSLIQFNIYDSFDQLVKSYDNYEEAFIDITINIYELKLKNEASEYISYSLNPIAGSVYKSGNLLPNEISNYYIYSNNYYFNYTNHEDQSENVISINLNNNKIIIVNTTYWTTYFSIFSYDGLGLDRDLARFYINGSRKDFGFNTLQSRYSQLTVLDYFNTTLYNETIETYGLSEYNIFVEVYTLNILNVFNLHDIYINISRGDIWVRQLIPVETSLQYRFQPHINYTISAYYTNNTLIETRSFNLTTNGQIESFGVKEALVPFFPKDSYISLFNSRGFGITDMLKLYKDSNRIDGGLTSIVDNSTQIAVLDYFNRVLYNRTHIYEPEISIQINTTTLAILNKYNNKSVNLLIRREDVSSWDIQVIMSPLSTVYFEFIQGEYEFKVEDLEGKTIERFEKDVSGDYFNVSFGFYSTLVPESPLPIVSSVMTMFWFIIIILIMLSIVGVLYIQLRRRYNQIPIEKRIKTTRTYNNQAIDPDLYKPTEFEKKYSSRF